MKLPRPARESPDVPLAPLIDMMFILLIFVVLVARFSQDEQIDIQPPQSEHGRPLVTEAGGLFVYLDRQGQLSIRGNPVEPARLPAVLAAAREAHDTVILVGDAQVPLQGAVDVLGAAAEAGFDEVGVVTRPP